MAKQIEGVYEKVLECAKLEFLEKGFKDASLRIIAQNSDTSTGSIYTRFSDKEQLFNAVVEPAVSALQSWFRQQQENFHQLPEDTQANHSFEYSSGLVDVFVDYLYEYFDLFKLLITGSSGTRYAEFINDIVEIDVAYTIKFMEFTGNNALSSGKITTRLIHILSSAYYSGLFEIVIHGMPREEAYAYARQLRRFFMCGWQDILGGGDG